METDFTVVGNPGATVFILKPNNDEAKAWIDEKVGKDSLYGFGGVAVGHRYIQDITNGLTEDGLTWE
jgi:hypothetical protein